MKIGFFCGGFSANGGIGRVTAIVSDALCKQKDVEVCLYGFYHQESNAYYKLNPECVYEEMYEQPISMVKALLFKNAIGRMVSFIKRNNIDIMVACGALYYPITVIAAKLCRVKVICWEHISPNVKSDYRFQNEARNFGAQLSNCNVVLTRDALATYNARFPKKKNVQIYNPIDSALEDKSVVYDVSSKKIISVGRLCYQKNFPRLINIAAKTIKNTPDWTWDIYGEGNDREELQQQINGLGLQNKVFLRGRVDNLYELYSEHSFIVMTSRYEGFAMVLLEGAANRLPMVAFDIESGPNEIIVNGENGFLCNKDSDEEMIIAIEQLIKSSELRAQMSEKSYETIKKFSVWEIVDNWIEIFNALLS